MSVTRRALVALAACLLATGCASPPTVGDAGDAGDGGDGGDAGDAAVDVADAPVDAPDAPAWMKEPECEPGETREANCYSLVATGTQRCVPPGVWSPAVCERPWPGGGAAPLPPRLLRPLSGMRVTSQRPTLRWQAPASATRVRVELCRDRACTRAITSAELGAVSSWRPPARLSPGVVFWRVRAIEGATWQSATWEFLVRHRDAEVDTAYGVFKDFDGDGYDDVVALTGSPSAPVLPELRVYPGGPRGMSTEPRWVSPVPEGDPRGPDLGNEPLGGIAGGDVNGDGYADLAVGQSLYNEGRIEAFSHGRVLVSLGGPDGLVNARTSARSVETEPWLRIPRVAGVSHPLFGFTVAIVDFDGDGYGDLLVSREHVGLRLDPYVYLFPGGPTGVSQTPASQTHLGGFYSLHPLGDVDGDGYGDVGSDHGLGAVVVFFGNPRRVLDERFTIASNTRGTYQLGHSMGAGDFDGDGFGDMVAGGVSSLAIFPGARGRLGDGVPRWPAVEAQGRSTNSFGEAVGLQGDINGDGYTDLVLGSWSRDGSGITDRLSLFAGGPSGIPPDRTAFFTWDELYASSPRDSTPYFHSIYRTASPGDVNGDGFDDIVLGSQYANRRDPRLGAEGGVFYFPGGPRWQWVSPSALAWGGSESRGLGKRVY